jgi:hypothetical protein
MTGNIFEDVVKESGSGGKRVQSWLLLLMSSTLFASCQGTRLQNQSHGEKRKAAASPGLPCWKGASIEIASKVHGIFHARGQSIEGRKDSINSGWYVKFFQRSVARATQFDLI